MWSCRERVDRPEWLDERRLSAAEVVANLHDLERVNRLLGGARSVLAHVPRALEGLAQGRPVRVLDIACGAGDVLSAVALVVKRRGLVIKGVGVDVNPDVLAYARRISRHLPELRWVCADARLLPFPPRSFDLVVCATFLHHLSPVEAPVFLHRAASLSRGGLIVADLIRSAPAAAGFALVARLLRFSPVTRHDGAVSLRRAYQPTELREFARAAGLRDGRVSKHPFNRMTLVCERNGMRP